MKKTDTFLNIDSLSYDTTIRDFYFVISEFPMPELLYLANECGFNINIEKGRAHVMGGDINLAKLLMDEIAQNFATDNEHFELGDYIRFKMWSDETFMNEITLAVKEVIAEKPYETKFIDVFEYIVDTWVLSDKEKNLLKKQDAEDYQERKHPDDK